VILERLKLQQEQVNRISRDLAQAREEASELKAAQDKLKEHIKPTQEAVDVGKQDASALTQLKAELEQLSQREQRVGVREARLENELAVERAKLNELNDRLNTLVEIELAPK
jgi:chromosome segregation ATPase